MRPLVFALLALTPPAALAQSQITLQLNTNQSEVTVGPQACGELIRADWTLSGAGAVACADLKFWVTPGTSCTDRPSTATGDVELESISQPMATSGFFNIPVNQLPLFVGAGGGASCPAPDRQLSYRVCGTYQTSGTQCVAGAEFWIRTAQPPRIHYDTRPPPAPVIADALGLDAAASVSVTAVADAATVRVEARADGFPTRSAEQDPRGGNLVVRDLENDVEYTVVATARDLAGNVSGESEPRTVTPVATAGLWQRYKDAGGAETGGCSATGGAALALWAVLAAVGIFRRKRS
jgi:uncharacterized protein (TIGR03382 family)